MAHYVGKSKISSSWFDMVVVTNIPLEADGDVTSLAVDCWFRSVLNNHIHLKKGSYSWSGAKHGHYRTFTGGVLWRLGVGERLRVKQAVANGYVCPITQSYGSLCNKPSRSQLRAWLLNVKSEWPFHVFRVFRIALVTCRAEKCVKNVLEMPL